MFENLKNKLKERKVDSLLKKILKEQKASFEIRDLESAFENEGEMKEILSEILSMYEYDDEAGISGYTSDFISYVDRRNEGYSRQWALWHLWNYITIEDELGLLMDKKKQSLDTYVLFAAKYYKEHSDSDITMQDIKVFAQKQCRSISMPEFRNACLKDLLSFCIKYRGNDRKYLGKESIPDKWLRLESVSSASIPSCAELEELSSRLKRMDDDDKRDVDEIYFRKVWSYLAHIASKRLDLAAIEGNKYVVALTVLSGLADDKFMDVDNAIKYVDNTLSLLDLNVPIQEIESLSSAANKQCKKEIEICREFQIDNNWAIDQLAKLVSIFGIVE